MLVEVGFMFAGSNEGVRGGVNCVVGRGVVRVVTVGVRSGLECGGILACG